MTALDKLLGEVRELDLATTEYRVADEVYIEARKATEFNYKEREKHLWDWRELDEGFDVSRGAAKYTRENAHFISRARTLLPKLAEIVLEYQNVVEMLRHYGDNRPEHVQLRMKGMATLKRAEEIAGRE